MHIKIYFGEKPVYLCDDIDTELHEILHHPDAVFIDEISNAAIKSLLHEIVKEEFHAGVVWHSDLEKLKKAFFKNFKAIEAAGGIVQNDKKELLFILRLGKWDLPKGKVEKGEDNETAAIREVEEETGVTNLKLVQKNRGNIPHVQCLWKTLFKNYALVLYDLFVQTKTGAPGGRRYCGNKMGENKRHPGNRWPIHILP